MKQDITDRRLTMRVLARWRSLAAGRRFPRRSQLDPLVIGPDWANCLIVDVDPEEPYAANALRIGKQVVYPASFPRTRARLERRGVDVRPVQARELAKAEGAVTCCSVVFSP